MKTARVLLLLGVPLILPTVPQAHGQYVVRYGHFNSGGGVSYGSHVALQTAGQVAVGISSGPESILSSGFWYCWYQMGGADVPEVIRPGPTALRQNYPNPFIQATTIVLNLERASPTRVVIYDITGARVRTLLDEKLPEGPHMRIWNGVDDAGRAMDSGVYICRLATDHAVRASRLVLLTGVGPGM